MEQSVEAMSAIPARMNEGWNNGDATAFVADFADDAELVDFEGTIHKGREAVIAFNQPLFDTVLKGSRMVRGEVPFARIVRPGWGVVHHRVAMVMPGEKEPLSSHYFMQLLALVWQNDRWEVATLQNARVISLETTMALDTQAADG
ncbi:SgcJ/EcaC family oxidoreductase [Streptomyces malaysiensis]|uniref:SgcJ/EcaC family oxidoreductase n=1 Tax=Streptomyces malaysiensis TaxID=92644 RepID=UPI002B311FA4|nr:SgcJ/EcaC family oxidoreductase [Streptomyces malaysiensis]